MKHSLIFLFFFAAAAAQAQQVTSSDTLYWRYLEISFPPRVGFETLPRIDTGLYDPGWALKWDLPFDEKGKSVKFRKPVEAHNWLSVRGWELYESHLTSDVSNLGFRVVVYRRMEPYRR